MVLAETGDLAEGGGILPGKLGVLGHVLDSLEETLVSAEAMAVTFQVQNAWGHRTRRHGECRR